MSQMNPSPNDTLIAQFCRLLVRIALAPLYPIRGILKRWIPYLYHIADTTARYAGYIVAALPVMVLALVLASFSVGGPGVLLANLSTASQLVHEVVTLVRGNLHYFALAVASYYLLTGITTYRPKDEEAKNYRWKNAPKVPLMWEHTIRVAIQSSAVAVLFAAEYFVPARVAQVPYGLVGVAVGLFAVAGIIQYVFTSRTTAYWVSKGKGEEISAKEYGRDWAVAEYLFWGALAGGMVSGIIPSFLGVSIVEGLFYANIIVTVRTLRNLRWLLYQDHDAYVNIKPRLWLWGSVSRLPVVYLAVVIVLGGFASAESIGFPIFCSFAPLVALAGYIPFRYYRLNGHMYDGLLRSDSAHHRDSSYVDMDGYVRGKVQLHLGTEAARSIHPKELMWTAARKAGTETGLIAKEVSTLEGAPTVEYDRLKLVNLTSRRNSTFKRRKDALTHARVVLTDVENAADKSDDPKADDILAEVTQIREEIRDAQQLNNEAGRLPEEFLNRFI